LTEVQACYWALMACEDIQQASYSRRRREEKKRSEENDGE
jgi:hypothetical protein